MPGLADRIQYSYGGGRPQQSLASMGAGPIDLQSKRVKRGPFGPAIMASALQQTPAMQEWANPEEVVQTQGVEQAYQGMDAMGRGARHAAANLGLGRSFATAAELNARQSALNEVSSQMLAATMLGQDRRAMMEQMLFDALAGGNMSAALSHEQHRAAQPSGVQQFGDIAGGAGAAIGGTGKLLMGLGAL